MQPKNILLRLTTILLIASMTAVLLCGCGGKSGGGAKTELERQLDGVCEYLDSVQEGVYHPGQSSSDWSVVIYSKTDREFDYKGFLKDMETYVTNQYKTEEKLGEYKATDWHHAILAIQAAGGDPEHFGTDPDGNPINLIADGTYNWSMTDELSYQGSNALTYALIVLDSGNYEIPEGSKYTREGILNELLEYQDEDGAFALGKGEQGSTDLTAITLQGLAPYYEKDPKVQEAVDRALDYMAEQQQDSGLFLGLEGYTSETISQTIMALCKLGKDPSQEERFTKVGGTLVDALMQFKMDDGSFAHELPDDTSVTQDNLVSSIQAAQALEALIELEKSVQK